MRGGALARHQLIPPQLRHALRRYQLVTRLGITKGGVGERRSRSKGEGIEFEDFRDYSFGDDMRRVDPHVFARLGQHVLRQYNVPGRLEVTLLVDLSPSMGYGEPPKADVALALAAGLALCALSHGDAVRCCVFAGTGPAWYPRLAGAGRFEELEGWLVDRRDLTAMNVPVALDLDPSQLSPGGLTVLISDLWGDDASRAVDVLGESGQDLVVIRVLSPEEVDPSQYGSGPVRFVDSESGDEVELDLGEETVASYLDHLRATTKEQRDLVYAKGGRFVSVRSDTPVPDLFERGLREAHVIR